jgi:L-2-hydroxyglutarate oxidase LhgO
VWPTWLLPRPAWPSTTARIEGFLSTGCRWSATPRATTSRHRLAFSRLIYPVPEKDGLGVHLTLDMGGQARFGPDVEWIESPDPAVNAARMPAFYGEIRKYWHGLADGQLRPDYAGVRPKIYARHEPAADFDIAGPAEHGVRGLVCLFGIESPGLTSALAVADEVATKLAH